MVGVLSVQLLPISTCSLRLSWVVLTGFAGVLPLSAPRTDDSSFLIMSSTQGLSTSGSVDCGDTMAIVYWIAIVCCSAGALGWMGPLDPSGTGRGGMGRLCAEAATV